MIAIQTSATPDRADRNHTGPAISTHRRFGRINPVREVDIEISSLSVHELKSYIRILLSVYYCVETQARK